MAEIFYMPMRGERTAPILDGTRARDLPRTFTDLETLFRRAKITDDNEKKKQVIYYTDFDTEQLWKYLPEFDDPTSTYADFKNAIMEFYPEAAEFLYSITDIDSLTDERQRLGMTSVQDLSDYHLQFLAITTWLIKKGQLSELEQGRAYIRAFPAQLQSTIVTRLQFKNPYHHPGIPYPVTDVYNTAKSLLHGISSLGITSQVQPITAPVLPTEKPIITEIFAPLIAEIKKTIIKTVKTAHTPARDNQIAITEVADIQPIFAEPNSTCVVQNTSNSTKEKFISPKPVEIYCNTHSPAEKSDPITLEPIPPPSNSPANQVQLNVTKTEPKPPTKPISNSQPTIPSITDNNLPIIKHLPTNSQPADQISIQPTHNPSANITDNSRQTTDNKLSNSKYLPSITDDDLPTIIYLPINTDKCREFTDKQLPTIKYLSTDSKYTVQQPILSNSNRPLVPPAIPILRKFKVFPPDIFYISLFTDFDKSPD